MHVICFSGIQETEMVPLVFWVQSLKDQKSETKLSEGLNI